MTLPLTKYRYSFRITESVFLSTESFRTPCDAFPSCAPSRRLRARSGRTIGSVCVETCTRSTGWVTGLGGQRSSRAAFAGFSWSFFRTLDQPSSVTESLSKHLRWKTDLHAEEKKVKNIQNAAPSRRWSYRNTLTSARSTLFGHTRNTFWGKKTLQRCPSADRRNRVELHLSAISRRYHCCPSSCGERTHWCYGQ